MKTASLLTASFAAVALAGGPCCGYCPCKDSSQSVEVAENFEYGSEDPSCGYGCGQAEAVDLDAAQSFNGGRPHRIVAGPNAYLPQGAPNAYLPPPTGNAYVPPPPAGNLPNLGNIINGATAGLGAAQVTRRDLTGQDLDDAAVVLANELKGPSNHLAGSPYWNQFSIPLDSDITTIAFRTLEWIGYSLIEPTEDITSAAGTRIFVDPDEQGGPLTLVLRGMIIWTDLLEKLIIQLEATNVWSQNTQLAVARSYADYAFQTAAFLKALTNQARDFDDASPVKGLVYNKLQAMEGAYVKVADLVYRGSSAYPQVHELITGTFPCPIPDWFKTKFYTPGCNQPIRYWLQYVDSAIGYYGGQFDVARYYWKNNDFQESNFGDAGLPGVGALPLAPTQVSLVPSLVGGVGNPVTSDVSEVVSPIVTLVTPVSTDVISVVTPVVTGVAPIVTSVVTELIPIATDGVTVTSVAAVPLTTLATVVTE